MKTLLSQHHQRLSSRNNKMIIENPLKFFEKPEAVYVINLVDIITRFESIIEPYLAPFEEAFVTVEDSFEVLKKSDVFLDEDGQLASFDNFMRLSGNFTVNNKPIVLDSKNSRKYFTRLSNRVISKDILLFFIKESISRSSNWETPFDLEDAIEKYIKKEYSSEDVVSYLISKVDSLIIEISNFYYDKDWNVFTTEFDGQRLYLKMYGDWRAYQWMTEKWDAYNESKFKDE